MWHERQASIDLARGRDGLVAKFQPKRQETFLLERSRLVSRNTGSFKCLMVTATNDTPFAMIFWIYNKTVDRFIILRKPSGCDIDEVHPETEREFQMARTVGSDGSKTEEAIRAAAVDLIAAHGFEAVTLRELARTVGIQAGSLYRYYPSKSDLLLTIMVSHMQDVLTTWQSERPTNGDPIARLNSFIGFHVQYHARKQKEVFIGNMEFRSLLPEHQRTVAHLRSEYESELTTILQDGVSQGVLNTPDIKVTTFAILAMLTGLTAWYREGGRLSKYELVECYRHLICRGVVTPQ